MIFNFLNQYQLLAISGFFNSVALIVLIIEFFLRKFKIKKNLIFLIKIILIHGLFFYFLALWNQNSFFKDISIEIHNLYDSLLYLNFFLGILMVFVFYFLKNRMFCFLAILMHLSIDIFIFHLQEQSWVPPAASLRNTFLFIPHIFSYFIAYSFLFLLVLVSFVIIFSQTQEKPWGMNLESIQYFLAKITFSFLSLGFFLGSLWADQAWGFFWFWDAKENWALASWIALIIYFHLRITNINLKLRSHYLIIVFFIHLFTYLGMDYLPEYTSGFIVHYYQ